MDAARRALADELARLTVAPTSKITAFNERRAARIDEIKTALAGLPVEDDYREDPRLAVMRKRDGGGDKAGK